MTYVFDEHHVRLYIPLVFVTFKSLLFRTIYSYGDCNSFCCHSFYYSTWKSANVGMFYVTRIVTTYTFETINRLSLNVNAEPNGIDTDKPNEEKTITRIMMIKCCRQGKTELKLYHKLKAYNGPRKLIHLAHTRENDVEKIAYNAIAENVSIHFYDILHLNALYAIQLHLAFYLS